MAVVFGHSTTVMTNHLQCTKVPSLNLNKQIEMDVPSWRSGQHSLTDAHSWRSLTIRTRMSDVDNRCLFIASLGFGKNVWLQVGNPNNMSGCIWMRDSWRCQFKCKCLVMGRPEMKNKCFLFSFGRLNSTWQTGRKKLSLCFFSFFLKSQKYNNCHLWQENQSWRWKHPLYEGVSRF